MVAYDEEDEKRNNSTCTWHYVDDIDHDCWETDCGEAYTFIDGSPHDNKMKFCCYCGRELIEE